MSVSVLPRPVLPEPTGFFSPQQFLRLVRRRARLIGLCALVGGAGAYGIGCMLTPYYTASALLSVDNARFLIPQLQGAVGPSGNGPDLKPVVLTEAEAVSSRQMVQSVIDSLHLADNPEFNPALRPPTLLQQATGWINSLLPAKTSPQMPGAGDAVVFGVVNRALKVTPDKTSLAFDVSFSSEDPELAANVVDKLISTYIDSLDALRRSSDQGANLVLTRQLKQVSSEIEALEQRMHDMRTKSEFVGLRAGSVGQQQLEDLTTLSTQASVDRAQIEAQWQRASALAQQGNPEALASVLSSPTISRLREQETTGLQRVADLSAHFGPNYPGVQSARADVAVARQQLALEAQRIVASLSTQLTVARAHEADTHRQLEAARQSGLKTADAQADLDQLQQEIAAHRTLYQSLLAGLQQSDNHPQDQSVVPQLRVLSKAVPPGLPAGPNKRLAAALGLVGGGMVGLLLTVSWRGRLPTYESVGDAMQSTGLTVLASLPRLSGRGSLADRVLADPGGVAAEELRGMRSRLRSLGRGVTPRSVVFTSAGRREDAGNVAAAFARLAAADGERVLLIEGDLQRPWLGEMLGAVPAGGLLPVLEAKANWRDQVARDRKVPLDLLLAGQAVLSPHALTSGNIFKNLLIEAAEEYTLIVLDAPSAAVASNAAALSSQVDATVVVIDAATTERASVSATVSRLASTRPDAMAAVLIGLT